MPKAVSKLVADPSTPPTIISKKSSGSTSVLFRRLLYQLRVQKLQLIVPGYGGPKKSRKPRQPLLTNYVWWVSGVKNTQAGSARFVEKNMIGSNQTGSWWCRQAKVLTRHRSSERMQYLSGLCGNLINALKLLTNQQEDGDGLIQKEHRDEPRRVGGRASRRGLREFIDVDNHRAQEAGHLNVGLGTFRVRRPRGSEGYPEVTLRERPDELTP